MTVPTIDIHGYMTGGGALRTGGGMRLVHGLTDPGAGRQQLGPLAAGVPPSSSGVCEPCGGMAACGGAAGGLADANR